MEDLPYSALDSLYTKKQLKLFFHLGTKPKALSNTDKTLDRFRWVSLSLQNFRGLTVERAVRNRLGRLPKDLQKLYQETYDHQVETGDEDQISIAKDAFRLLLCLENTMPTEEFLTALSFCNWNEEILIKDDLLELCFNFVTDDQESDSFRFAHLSVREFLETKEGFDRESCHRTAAIFCLRCVSAPGLAYRLFPNYPVKKTSEMDETASLSGEEENGSQNSYQEMVESPEYRNGLPSDPNRKDNNFQDNLQEAYQSASKNLTSYEYASMLWPYHLSLSGIHRLSEPLKTMAFTFLLGDDPDTATFHEWSNVMYEDGWRLMGDNSKVKSLQTYEDGWRLTGDNSKVMSLPTHGSKGQPINYKRAIHDSYRWTSKNSRPLSRFLTSEFSPKPDPIFISCVWDFSNILQARVDSDATSIDLESDVPQRDALEKAWWTAAEPANRVRALDLACLYENYDCVKILLEAGAKPTSHLALSFGIQAQRADIVQLLLEHGTPFGRQSDIEMWNQEMEWPTGFGSNPLHQAVIIDSPTILDMLLRHGADPNIRIEGISALDLAKSQRKLELVRRFTDADANSGNNLTLPLDEHSAQDHNHVLFGNILRHLTREKRLRLYFGLQRSEDTEVDCSRQDVEALLKGGAEGPLFTYSKDHELLLVVTKHDCTLSKP